MLCPICHQPKPCPMEVESDGSFVTVKTSGTAIKETIMSMGNTKDELMIWMLEVAESRLGTVKNNRVKTINMKFSKLTLEMWVNRVKKLQTK